MRTLEDYVRQNTMESVRRGHDEAVVRQREGLSSQYAELESKIVSAEDLADAERVLLQSLPSRDDLRQFALSRGIPIESRASTKAIVAVILRRLYDSPKMHEALKNLSRS